MYHPEWTEKLALIKKPSVIGVSFMGDLFHDNLSGAPCYEVIDAARSHKQHAFILLTKRYRNMRVIAENAVDHFGEWFPNIWWGMSAWGQCSYDLAVRAIDAMPKEINTWLSIEPMIGPIEPHHWLAGANINQVIVGGESGNRARPMPLEWARTIRDACTDSGTPFYFKQFSNKDRPHSTWSDPRAVEINGLPVLDGRIHNELAWRLEKKVKEEKENA
jgi:protein gp37